MLEGSRCSGKPWSTKEAAFSSRTRRAVLRSLHLFLKGSGIPARESWLAGLLALVDQSATGGAGAGLGSFELGIAVSQAATINVDAFGALELLL
jgi:hypothetical protein